MINDPVEAEATWTVTLQIPDWPDGRARVVPFWSSASRKRCSWQLAAFTAVLGMNQHN
jgi:hypothetical protein